MHVYSFEDMPDATAGDVDMLCALLLWHSELVQKAREGTILPFEVGFLSSLPARIAAARWRAQARVFRN